MHLLDKTISRNSIKQIISGRYEHSLLGTRRRYNSVAYQAISTIMERYNRDSQFKFWFPFFEPQLLAASQNCTSQLNAYWTYQPVGWHKSCGTCATSCALVMSCLLSTLQEHVKANMASAAVLLGFLPTMLSFIGPSLNEITPMMLNRPVLASLLVLGSPALSPTTVFEAFEFNWSSSSGSARQPRAHLATIVLNQLYKLPREGRGGPWMSQTSWTYIIGFLQITTIFAAAANSIWIAVLLDVQTRVVWQCSLSGQVILWTLIGLPVRWLCVLGFLYPRLLHAGSSSVGNGQALSSRPERSDSASAGAQPKLFAKLVAAIKQYSSAIAQISVRRYKVEATPTLFRHDPWDGEIKERTTNIKLPAELTYCAASLMALIHYGYGTFLFSSLLFIAVNDAVQLLARYAASILCCRLVLLFELECMKYKLREANAGANGEVYGHQA